MSSGSVYAALVVSGDGPAAENGGRRLDLASAVSAVRLLPWDDAAAGELPLNVPWEDAFMHHQWTTQTERAPPADPSIRAATLIN